MNATVFKDKLKEVLIKLMDNDIVPMLDNTLKEILGEPLKRLSEIELVENAPLKLLENEYKNCIDIASAYLIRHWAATRIIDVLKTSKIEGYVSKKLEISMANSNDKELIYFIYVLLKATRIKLSIEKINQSK